jgi:hypothetical protein
MLPDAAEETIRGAGPRGQGELIDCCDDAGVSLVRRDEIDTPAATSEAVARGDALQ